MVKIFLHPSCLQAEEPQLSQVFFICEVLWYLNHPRSPFAFFASRAHYWFISNLVSTRTPRSFSAELLCIWATPIMYQCLGLFLFRLRISWGPWSPFLQLLISSGWQHGPLAMISATAPSLVSPANLLRVHWSGHPYCYGDEQDRMQYWPLRYTAGHWHPTRLVLLITSIWPQQIQPNFSLLHSLLIHQQLLCGTFTGESVTGTTVVQVDNSLCFHHVHQDSHFIKEVYQVGKIGLPIGEATLNAPHGLLLFTEPGNYFQD